MAVKQYIGARYVPKFASPIEWAANTSYEALTIVTFNNASYTSKVQVPPTIGNPANNPQYWALTGNYNSQVEQYRQETEKATEDAAKAAEDAAKVSTDLATEIQNRTAEDNTITENFNDKLEKEAQDRTNALNALSKRGHSYILLGDSFSNGVDGNNPTTTVAGGGWIQRFKDSVGPSIPVYSEPSTPVTGLARFYGGYFLNLIKSIEASIDNDDSITDIIVLAGTNEPSCIDQTNFDAVQSQIAAFINYCKNTFKNAKIGIGILSTLCYANQYARKLECYQTCTLYGAYYIADTAYLYNIASMVGTDKTHLTQYGYSFYTKYVNEAILTGHCHYSFAGWSKTDMPAPSGKAIFIAETQTESGSNCAFYLGNATNDYGDTANFIWDFKLGTFHVISSYLNNRAPYTSKPTIAFYCNSDLTIRQIGWVYWITVDNNNTNEIRILQTGYVSNPVENALNLTVLPFPEY